MPDRAKYGFSQGFPLPWVTAEDLTEWMGKLAPLAADFQRGGLRFVAEDDLSVRPFLPHWNSKPMMPRETVTGLRETLAGFYRTSHDPSRQAAQPMDMSTTIDLPGAMILGIVAAGVPANPDIALRHEDHLAVFLGRIPDLAHPVSQAMRRSRSPSLSVFDLENETVFAAVHLSDDPDDGATLEGLRAGQPSDFDLLAPVQTSSGTVWIDGRRSIPGEARPNVGALLAAMRTLGLLPDDHDLIIVAQGDRDYRFAAIPEKPAATPVEEIARQTSSETLLSVTPLRPIPSEQAQRDLQAHITSAHFPLGYRVSLETIPDAMRGEPDIEGLREEIAEREAQIALLRALAAPQMRLLRFTDAQLPALVDALRKLPTDILHNSDLRYAAGHAAGRAEPAHFLLYDPAILALEGLLREHFWRGQTDNHPIRYWLDPHAAQALGRAGKTQTWVFTPVHQRLIPAIDSFGGTLDETLRLLLGNLFADASAVLDADGAQPVFLFSPPGQSGADMEIELLDARWFQPVHLTLRWINDYMVVRSPRIADRKTLSRLAEDLYEGQTAEVLRAEAQARSDDLRAAWTDAQSTVQAQIDEVLAHIVSEIQTATQRLRLGRRYLTEVKTRIAEMDTRIATVRDMATEANEDGEALTNLAPDFMDERFAMVASLIAELELGDQAMAQAEEKVRAELEKIETLEQKLRSL
ncbi:hypothetical protein [Allosediminivita pacifica]|uniref:Uncharacterized protein n=1 Tax=Allosediminivita pacifica TaxID=1267769 RepID=A0A2T6A5G3_9RHOB|nr:hypothetical protein [Allosediminivita pacifica]PTX39016.1 hypothetical protein C8N44_1409 [Allosediminivita pacifica]GGB28437.1 hypothetical protein GCM10011324_42670 [Allosediminivita pacifica]